MIKSNDEVIRMLNAYNKGAEEGDTWSEKGYTLAVFHGTEWVRVLPFDEITPDHLRANSDYVQEMEIIDTGPAHPSPKLSIEALDVPTSETTLGSIVPSNMLMFGGANGMMVTIDTSTGEIEFGENYDLNETARIFWESIALMSPGIPNQCTCGDNEAVDDEDYSCGDEEWLAEEEQLSLQACVRAAYACADTLLFKEQENGEVYSRLNPDYDWDSHGNHFTLENTIEEESDVDPFDAARGVIE